MARRKTLINKQDEKMAKGKCYFCNESDYALLDCHRIIPGEQGGKYTNYNTLVTCSNCHRRIHDGQIVIDRKYFSTTGKWILHYFENGEEKWQ